MLWWSSNDTSETKASENDVHENASPMQPETVAHYGLPADRALEPLHLPSVPSPALASAPAPMASPASPKVVAEPQTLSTRAERLDKQWLQHMLDEHMSKMQESINNLQKSVDERFEAVESDVARARSQISANTGHLKTLGLAYSNLETETRQAKAYSRSSIAKLSQAGPQSSSSNMMREVQDAVQYVQESMQEQANELSRVQRNLNGYVRDSVRKIKQELYTINQKFISLSISASLFSLKVGEMNNWERSHSVTALRRKQAAMQEHAKLEFDDNKDFDPTEQLRFEAMLSAGEEPSSPTGTATKEWLQSAELEIEQIVDETTLATTPERTASMEAKPSVGYSEKSADMASSQSSRPGADQQQLRSLVEEIASNELQGLDAKLTLLSLSSNLFCMKTIDLSKSMRKQCTSLVETQLKALRQTTGHLGKLSYFPTSVDAVLEALVAETRRLESSHDAGSDAEEEAARSKDIGVKPAGPVREPLSPCDEAVPPEIEQPVRMRYSRPTSALVRI
eukprot:TRINITY_DN58834_c0_g1_i1.p1 TRINITY_DN58834_c0_g1~~TRINITY_DN58834_c0_g1_i1.p1  ORF type:complete len:511 (+),score=113.53 TRINITY_DN58834_c0_g1_i1:172-1704(+)